VLGPIRQIAISVTDVDRSVAFYRDALGLPLLFQVPEQSLAFFDCHGVRLFLTPTESEDLRSRPLLYFSVESIDEARRALSERGVEFAGDSHVVHRDGATELWLALFHDPDGTPLALMEERTA
jgi:catechol 2,3-dioxygenase-like lactoylglutathione lyase family enzyme